MITRSCIWMALLLAACNKRAPEPSFEQEAQKVAELQEDLGSDEKKETKDTMEKAHSAISAPPDVAAPPKAGAEKTASGLVSKQIKEGEGKAHPSATDRVKVHYTGWTTDGKMFDSSLQRGQPATFPLNGVIAGWTEGLQLMVEGEKRRFWIPEELAYKGQPGKPAGMLVFDVELLEIEK